MQSTLNCRGRLLDLSSPLVMGILNVTPDSFFDGGHFTDKDAALQQAEKMLQAGASILDIGGASSRPGAKVVSETEEIKRVVPVIEAIVKQFPEAILSIDTWRAAVAREAIQAGASIVNDIAAGRLDEAMYETVGRWTVDGRQWTVDGRRQTLDGEESTVSSESASTAPPLMGGLGGAVSRGATGLVGGPSFILMHMQGTPSTMQQNPVYQDVVQEVLDFFISEIAKLRALGIYDIVLDPGFGFGKTVEQNYLLLKNLHVFSAVCGLPVLAGLSRKSMICKVLKVNPEHALNGTTALHMIALQQGAKILRVHDVREAIETIKLWEMSSENLYAKN